MGDKLKIKHTRMTFDEWNRSIVKKMFIYQKTKRNDMV